MTRLIDLEHLGRDRLIGAFVVDGFVIDPGPETCLDVLLAGLGDEAPRGLLLTHIHLDHAGAAGALVRRFPALRVYVHERGAPHLVDPSRLVASAAQVYGAQMERLWGEVAPVPAENVITVGEGDSVDGFSVAYTPGHARHHVCYLHEASGDAFTGDVAGLTIPPSGFVLAPTPPPEVDLDAWNGSLDRLLAWRPERACVTHCGAFAGVPERVGAVRENLSWLAELARRGGRGRFVANLLEALRAACDEESVVERFVQAAPPDQLHAGLARYWATRA